MGGCGHRVLKSLYISRHDGAMRKGAESYHPRKTWLVPETCRYRSRLAHRQSGHDRQKKNPRWLIPDDTLEECNLPAADRHVLRPDILLIEVTHEKQV